MKTYILLFCLSFFATHTFSQGCSDAGFCSVASLKETPGDSTELYKGKLTIGTSFGKGDNATTIFTPFLQYDHFLGERVSIQGKLTGNVASGDLGSASGFGDFYVTGSYIHSSKKVLKWAFSLGAKLPLSDANIEQDGRSLPLVYQSSLGTYDLIGGIRLSVKNASGTIGIQYPLFTTNPSNRAVSENTFDPSYWLLPAAGAYPRTANFTRKPDALLKFEYLVKIKKRLRFTPGVLGIYHLANDEYTLVNGVRAEHIGSQGLTVNLTLNTSFALSSNWHVSLIAGAPVVVRDSRPDGLTRHFVLAPQISYRY